MKGIHIMRRKEINSLPFQIAVGQVTQLMDKQTREVKVLKMEMNDYLKMYFNKSFLIKSVDTGLESKKGDIVLIRKLAKPLVRDQEFSVDKVLFRIDDITDPITGKKISHEEQEVQKHLDSIIKSFNK